MSTNILLPKTIEDFLNEEVATRYALKNHHVWSVRKEVFGTAEDLFEVFTHDIKKYDRFRKGLRDCLGADVGARPRVAE